ncbi:MAG: DUF58 domain-containing protein [Verrucomicrobiales bacterium]|nr:DUF58 domain-containing protein [Verrucomicrobiales bacterium]
MAIPFPAETLNSLAAHARDHAGRFSLPLKDRNWRGGQGDFAGAGVGSSIDFQDHRSYVAGDDPRHINWQAFARTGSYSLKLYREEVRPTVEILFDVSDSMFAEPEKGIRAIELFYFATASAEKSGASTTVFLVKGDHWKPIEREAVLSHRWQDAAASLPSTTASASPDLASLPLASHALRIFISDLLFPSSPEPIFRSLQRGASRSMFLVPFSSAESAPEWSGNYEFIDTESGIQHDRRIDQTLLDRYLAAYRSHFECWKTASLRSQAPLARIPSGLSFENAILREAIPSGAILLL